MGLGKADLIIDREKGWCCIGHWVGKEGIDRLGWDVNSSSATYKEIAVNLFQDFHGRLHNRGKEGLLPKH